MNRTELVKNVLKKINGNIIVEIGTWKGDFADFLLENSTNTTLYAVDPYIKYTEFNDSCNDYVDDNFYNDVKNRLETKFGDRIKMVRKTSYDAVDDIPNNIDFLYIDGNHKYSYVFKELQLYYDKVKPGGFIIGDDAFDTDESKRNAEGDIYIVHPNNWGYGSYGVIKAFKDFEKLKNIKGENINGQYVLKKE
jgi:predicted O-methyltransferase YrrM